jgi:predicted nucleic acid-binding protein
MTDRGWPIDKSALVCLVNSVDAQIWSNRIGRGLVYISNMTRLEVGYSARTGDATRRELGAPPVAAIP